jgi:hypothetical protein
VGRLAPALRGSLSRDFLAALLAQLRGPRFAALQSAQPTKSHGCAVLAVVRSLIRSRLRRGLIDDYLRELINVSRTLGLA